MKAHVSEEYTAVNPIKEAKERKRQLKMMATSIGVQDADGRPMSARSGATQLMNPFSRAIIRLRPR